MVFDTALDADARAQLMYALSQKWGLTQVTDSDGDGVLDYIDESPAPLAPRVARNRLPLMSAVEQQARLDLELRG